MSSYVNLFSRILYSIQNTRSYYMGVSMLVVLLFHAYIAWGGLFVFKYGFIGVDVFLLLSSYGLCFSYKNSTLCTFYKRRIKRVIPYFVSYAIVATIIGCTLGNHCASYWDLFCNITTLSYYNVGGWFIDWYLSALVFLYLTFPIFYHLINLKTFILLFVGITCFFILYDTTSIQWKHICLLARVPIFSLGVILYKSFTPPYSRFMARKTNLLFGSMVLLGCILTITNLVDTTKVSFFFVTSLYCPAFILICWYFKTHLNKRCEYILNFMGDESLLIYLANILSQLLLDLIYFHNPYRLMLYILLNFIFISIIYKLHYKRLKSI